MQLHVSRTVTRERPLGVVVIALFLIADAAFAIGQIALDTSLSTRTDTLLEVGPWVPGVMVAAAILRLLAAGGLWLGYRWAWALSMLLAGFALVTSFYVYWLGDPAYVPLALNVILAFYLNQGAVHSYFEAGGNAAEVPTGGSG